MPSSPEEAKETGKDFPHKLDEITKQALSTKLKAVQLKYRQALDSGRRSGHGRVVLLYFEWCEKIWGSSPATEQIFSGVETIHLDESQASQLSENKHCQALTLPLPQKGKRSMQLLSGPVVVSPVRYLMFSKEGHYYVDSKLSNYKQEKLKKTSQGFTTCRLCKRRHRSKEVSFGLD